MKIYLCIAVLTVIVGLPGKTVAQADSTVNRALPAPQNPGPFVGRVNGIALWIPKEFRASVSLRLVQPQSSSHQNERFSADDMDVSEVVITLRRATFEPIRSMQDLHDFANNFMKPYLKTKPEQRWLMTTLFSKLYAENNGTLKQMYGRKISEETKIYGPFSSPDTYLYGLQISTSQHESGPMKPNQFYFDNTTGNTLIECSNLKSIDYFGCTHYFVVSELKVIAKTSYTSTEEIAHWQQVEAEIRKIAAAFVRH